MRVIGKAAVLAACFSGITMSAWAGPFVGFSISGTGQSSGLGLDIGNTAIDTFITNNPDPFNVDLDILFDTSVSGTQVDPGIFRFGAGAISSIGFTAGDTVFSGLKATSPQPITVTIPDENGNPIEVPLLDAGIDPTLFVFDELDAGNGVTVDGFSLNLDINSQSDFVGATDFPTDPLVSSLLINFFVTDDIFNTSNGFELVSLGGIDGSSLDIVTDSTQAPNLFSLLAFDPSGVTPAVNIIPGGLPNPFPFVSGVDLFQGELTFDTGTALFRTVDVVTPVPVPASLALFALGLAGLGAQHRRHMG